MRSYVLRIQGRCLAGVQLRKAGGIQPADGWSMGVQRESELSLGHGRCRKEQERSSDWRVSGANILTSGVQGARQPLSDGCRESRSLPLVVKRRYA